MPELQTWWQGIIRGLRMATYLEARNGALTLARGCTINTYGVRRFMYTLAVRISSFIHIQSLSVARNKMNYSSRYERPNIVETS